MSCSVACAHSTVCRARLPVTCSPVQQGIAAYLPMFMGRPELFVLTIEHILPTPQVLIYNRYWYLAWAHATITRDAGWRTHGRNRLSSSARRLPPSRHHRNE